MIIGIVAIAKNRAIGREGKLPWHYSADLKFFKATTTGNAVVMGWNTWKSLKQPLPNRVNIVLSKNNNIENQPEVLLMRSREEVLAHAKKLKCDLYVIGGAKTYEAFADVIEKWIVTEIPVAVAEADAFLPADFLKYFERSEEKILDGNLRVSIYERKRN